MTRWKKILLCIAGGVLLVVLLIASQFVCLSAWIAYGVLIPECAEGDMKLGVTLDASALRRGSPGEVEVGAVANYTTRAADYAQVAPVGRLEAKLFLLNGTEKKELEPDEEGWESSEYSDRQVANIELPADLPDGEYRLRAEVDTPLGEGSVEAPLLVFAPAVVHVITDRPLYEAGNTIRFRAVVLRARDLIPLDGRPGRWVVTDPTGESVLEEKAPAGEFGVAAGDFPLDEGATTGAWRVRWESGAASDEVTVQVEPFTLPRFSVEAAAVKSFYRAGEKPRLRGRVAYSSGAPVADADLELGWSHSGGWPPPSSWMSGGLPPRTTSGKNGEFEVTLPEVPRDLQGRATLFARIAAIDPAGDRAEGSAPILLSEDAIQVDTVTEFSGGLAEGFNNRVFLRASTAAGGVLPETKLLVKRTWDPTDNGVEALTDEDGVAVLQLDPGPAVNVIIPPMPVRPPPRPKPIQRLSVDELIGNDARLADQVALDRANASLEPCARFVAGSSDTLRLSLWVEASGTVHGTAGAWTPLARCFERVLRTQKFRPGAERIYRIDYAVSSDLPSIQVETGATLGEPIRLNEALIEPLLDARTCLPDDVEEASFPRLITFRIEGDRLETRWVPDRNIDRAVPAGIASCVESRLSNLELKARRVDDDTEETEADSEIGFVRLRTQPGARHQDYAAQETVMLGYEMTVAALAKDGEELGQTKVRLSPGAVPDLRLRPSKVLAEAGETIEMTLIRGPSFTGELPEKLILRHELKELEAKLDEKTRTAKFTLPAELDGWFESAWGGARALIYVRPKSQLSVSVTPDRERYRPRDRAELTVRIVAGDAPAQAAVTLMGVDQSLAQLVPLPGPDDMARIRPKVSISQPAFGVLDAEALALGRIRGKNAAAATVLQVQSIPTPADYDAYVSVSGATTFDPIETLTDHFYLVLAELHAQVRSWERSAAADEVMRPPKMAEMWNRALAECKKRGEPVTDAFDRDLALEHLPEDLLALTAPRAVVIEGTRLPEDVENWSEWVRRNRP